MVLMAADGAATRAIARALGCTIGTASKWRVRYAKDRLAGFSEVGARGAEAKYGKETGRRILALLDKAPPDGYANWSGPLIARALGDVHVQYVWRFLRAQKIDLSGRKSWCVSNDPEFAAKAAEIVGLYMAPPDNAIVLAVDEKPSIQALERAQGYLKLPNGRAMTGWDDNVVRRPRCGDRRSHWTPLQKAPARRIPQFHERSHRRFPRPRDPCRPRLSLHPQAQPRHVAEAPQERPFPLHATYASWLSQIEIWFSILTEKSLNGASFTSAEELITHIDAFIADYNHTARPFVWTKSEVHQKRLKPCLADQ